jgi:hypothetical protein
MSGHFELGLTVDYRDRAKKGGDAETVSAQGSPDKPKLARAAISLAMPTRTRKSPLQRPGAGTLCLARDILGLSSGVVRSQTGHISRLDSRVPQISWAPGSYGTI